MQHTTAGLEHSEPWLDDGNIVLVAQDKGFRVHRSVLGYYSEIFKDMFAIPHSDDIEENVIDGCPVVHLQDASGDVQIILKALYDRSCLFFSDEPMPITILVAFLRLGKKYAIRQLFKEAVHRLTPGVPLLELVSKISDTEDVTLFPRISGTDPRNFMIMNIANEIGNLSMVAIAVYYCCVTCPALSIIDGYEFDGNRCTLSLPNQRYCFLGQYYVAGAQRELSVLLADSDPDDENECDSDCDCDCDCSAGSILCSFCKRRGPFVAWETFRDDGVCTSCRGALECVYKVTSTRLWNNFPVRLGLGSWDDLDKDIEILQKVPNAE